INWRWICYFQKFSLDFIREFKDKVDWKWISYDQKLSYSFICEFRDKLDLDILVIRKIIKIEKIIKIGEEAKEIRKETINKFEFLDI
ncbi:hypothetical protein LCGC14_2104960, partial [marine sediment metagenome]